MYTDFSEKRHKPITRWQTTLHKLWLLSRSCLLHCVWGKQFQDQLARRRRIVNSFRRFLSLCIIHFCSTCLCSRTPLFLVRNRGNVLSSGMMMGRAGLGTENIQWNMHGYGPWDFWCFYLEAVVVWKELRVVWVVGERALTMRILLPGLLWLSLFLLLGFCLAGYICSPPWTLCVLGNEHFTAFCSLVSFRCLFCKGLFCRSWVGIGDADGELQHAGDDKHRVASGSI